MRCYIRKISEFEQKSDYSADYFVISVYQYRVSGIFQAWKHSKHGLISKSEVNEREPANVASALRWYGTHALISMHLQRKRIQNRHQ